MDSSRDSSPSQSANAHSTDELEHDDNNQPRRRYKFDKQFQHPIRRLDTHSNVQKKKTNSFRCHACGKRFTSRARLDIHLAINDKAKPLQCRTCDQEFMYKCQLAVHAKSHLDSFQCKVCGRRCRQMSSLQAHKILHTRVRPFECSKCGKTFRYRGHLAYHLRCHARAQAAQPVRRLRLKKLDKVKVPGNSSENDDTLPFRCDLCGKLFRLRSALVVHQQWETGKRPRCEQCGKRFRSLLCLRAHTATHGKIITCPTCGKTFTNGLKFRLHSRMHVGREVSRFRCNVCGKGFYQKQHFEEHVLIHTDERPFACGLCGVRFRQGGSMRRHLVAVHGRDQTEGSDEIIHYKRDGRFVYLSCS